METNSVQCSICMEERSRGDIVMVVGDVVCQSCFRESVEPLLQGALQYEARYPPRWGTVELKPYSFAKLLPQGFIRSYVDRVREYNTPSTNRLYCPHRVATSAGDNQTQANAPNDKHPTNDNLTNVELTNRYLTNCGTPGQNLTIDSSLLRLAYTQPASTTECGCFMGTKSDTEGQTLSCSSCKGLVCGSCDMPIFGDEAKHSCQVLGKALSLDNSFQGLTQGEDYQICPGASCGVKIFLEDGCNHMICRRCQTNFCYICGEEAKPGNGHWNQGSACPRYNQPGAQNAQHDGNAPGLVILPDNAEWVTVRAGRRQPDDQPPAMEAVQAPVAETARLLRAMVDRQAAEAARPPPLPAVQRAAQELVHLRNILEVTWQIRRDSAPPAVAPSWFARVANFLHRIWPLRRREESSTAANWTVRVIIFGALLMPNLQVGPDLEAQQEEFDRRHEQMMTMMPTMSEPFERSPRLREIVESYSINVRSLTR